MTFDLFVETKFIPEHVVYKSLAGQTHYQAMLKHLLTPEKVNVIFNPRNAASARLKSIAGWPYLDGVRLCDLKADHVRRIIAASQTAGYASQTVKHIKNVIFAIISHAQNEGCFEGTNPAALVKLPRIIRSTQDSLTFQQSMEIVEFLPSPEKEVALFAITTGMNLIELCQLRWEHVNLSGYERILEGECIPAWSIGVRNSWNCAGVGDGRTGSRNRSIQIREPLLTLLKERIQRSPTRGRDGFLFASQDGGPISPSSIKLTRLKQAGRELGVPWVTWQMLRRTHVATPHYVTSAMLDPATTMNAYRSGDAAWNRMVSLEARNEPKTQEIRPGACSSFCFGNRSRVAIRGASPGVPKHVEGDLA
jgi:integrase